MASKIQYVVKRVSVVLSHNLRGAEGETEHIHNVDYVREDHDDKFEVYVDGFKMAHTGVIGIIQAKRHLKKHLEGK